MTQNLQKLQEQLSILEQRVALLDADRQIQNLMGRFAFYQSVGDYHSIMEKLYSSRKDRSYEEGCTGIYRDNEEMPERILAYFHKRYGIPSDPEQRDELRGRLVINALTSPVIVPGDEPGTMKGLWITSGHETIVYGKDSAPKIPSLQSLKEDKEDRKYLVEWVWQKYVGNFVLENGEWRIHDLHVYDIFRSPYYEDWVSYSQKRSCDELVRDEILEYGKYPFPPCTGTSYHWQYMPDALPPEFPVIP